MQETAILTVSELTESIKKNLESAFPCIQVQGEILNFKQQPSGHLYFTLKDTQAQISAVFFKSWAQKLKNLPKNGDQVIVEGEINVYPPRGNYQIIVRNLRYVGTGQLLLKLYELKLALQNEGLFDLKNKQPLPVSPKTIGVVTSSTGAVIQDILHILSRRHHGFHLLLNPVKVQGEGAAQEIAQAIEQFNQYELADVLIVGRGGGSLEDLWPFNEEIVARAIFLSKIPVISAVGHETDFCISDFVADVRAPTPSAAAEIVLAASEQHLQHLDQLSCRLQQAIDHWIEFQKHRIHSLSEQLALLSPKAYIENHFQKLDDIFEKIEESLLHYVSIKHLEIQSFYRQLETLNPLNRVQHLQEKLLRLSSHLKSIDPKNLLRKGYCIIFRENSNSVIFSNKEVEIGDPIRILTQDGEYKAKVYEI